jgi:hypothetical protein
VNDGASQAYGGIIVRNEVRVDISDVPRDSDVDVERRTLGTQKSASVTVTESETLSMSFCPYR